jgi:hypothetical protein
MKDGLAKTDSMPVKNIQEAQGLTSILTRSASEKIELPPRYENMLESPMAVFAEGLLSDISGSDSMRQLHECLGKMVEAYRELEGKLNPMVLRPMILGTRCGLCPV